MHIPQPTQNFEERTFQSTVASGQMQVVPQRIKSIYRFHFQLTRELSTLVKWIKVIFELKFLSTLSQDRRLSDKGS